jgi:hypothetical protein
MSKYKQQIRAMAACRCSDVGAKKVCHSRHERLFIDLHDHLPAETIYERELLICRLSRQRSLRLVPDPAMVRSELPPHFHANLLTQPAFATTLNTWHDSLRVESATTKSTHFVALPEYPRNSPHRAAWVSSLNPQFLRPLLTPTRKTGSV